MLQKEILIADLISRYIAGERDFSGVIIQTPSIQETYFWEPGQFKGLDLSGIILRNSSIRWMRIYMGGVILRGADLTNVDLGESNFTGADLSNARMRGVRIFQSDFDYVNLNGADLAGAVLVESDFHCANLSRVNLRNARIHDMWFSYTNLTEVIFKRAKLENVTFGHTKLVRTDFRSAKFKLNSRGMFGVEFQDCHFEDTFMPDGSVRSGYCAFAYF